MATDRPGSLALRQRIRPSHRAYLRSPGLHTVRVLLAGPTAHEANGQMNGTVLIVESSSAAAVERFIADDPYSRAGLFEQVVIRPWTCGMGRFEADSAIQATD